MTFARTNDGRHKLNRSPMKRIIPFFVLVLLLAAGCKDEVGKVAGTVTFQGVNCQEGQPDFKVPPCTGAYPKYEIKVFKAGETENPVLTTMTGDDGSYSIDLPAGDYVIFTQNGPKESNKQENAFKVEKEKTTSLPLRVHTGIL